MSEETKSVCGKEEFIGNFLELGNQVRGAALLVLILR